MASTYTTPGVYVVEKSLFPPSVAQVETAIPAFIGYTEKAIDKKEDDLLLKPKRIKSLLEYHRYFGGAPVNVVNRVDLSPDNTVADVDITQIFYLYDSLRLFFANGGGDCYIIAVENYDVAGGMLRSHFEDGLEVLKKKDEPTIIVFPDAVSLTNENDLYELQKLALAQCSELQDRVGVFDTYYGGEDEAVFWTTVDRLRDHIGVDNLKYGAVYTPWLRSSLPRSFSYADIYANIYRLGTNIRLTSITGTTDAAIKQLLDDYDALLQDRTNMKGLIQTATGVLSTQPIEKQVKGVLNHYDTLLNTFKTGLTNLANTQANYRNLIDYTYKLASLLDDLLQTTGILTLDLNNTVSATVTTVAATQTLKDLVAMDVTIGGNANLIGVAAAYPRRGQTTVIPANTVANWINANLAATLFLAAPPAYAFHVAVPAAGAPGDPDRLDNMIRSEATISKAFLLLYNTLESAVISLNNALTTKEQSLYSAYPVYKSIIDYINQELTLLPPSGAVAGRYAYVDDTRGVWKAPANVSLNYVTGVSIELTDKDQGSLNVDVNSGKSINVIRPFTGKGTLIWGARTLAGNDNEWRYVSVRRFFNMVEESVKKSTFWAVFEPNDANTWNKVKGMIDNFLTIQWRNGALQGAKPNEAFFVKIGLGQTMTALDILEGRMNVEIGMAVVRPAEFIILTFTHKLVTTS